MLDASYLETLVKKTADFGSGKIHIIVNNAGFTWDGVIHKVNLLQYNMGLRYLADWEMLDLTLPPAYEERCTDIPPIVR